MTGSNYLGGLFGGNPLFQPMRHKIFVSYHHAGDQAYYNAFSNAFHDTYDAITDRSLEREIDSDNTLYVMQRIRETCISGTSCTIVLVGANTYKRKYVDWEIHATLDKQHALIGVRLPTAPVLNNAVIVPDRLAENIHSGYASWLTWQELTASAETLQVFIAAAKARDTRLIKNGLLRMTRNSA